MNRIQDETMKFSSLRIQAEEKAIALNMPEQLKSMPQDQALYELSVHQIELEMQNEELRETHEKLEASRARYFDFYDKAPVGYFNLDDKGRILEANLTAANLLGVNRNLLIKKMLTRYIHIEDQDIFYQHLRKILGTDIQQVCELRFLKNDIPFWVRVETIDVQNADGVPVCRTVVSDINARKILEKELMESEAKYERITRSIADFLYTIVVKNEKFFKIICDESCFIITGYTAREFAENPNLWSNMIHPEDRELLDDRVFKKNSGKKFISVEHRIIRKSREIRWVSNTLMPEYDSNGRFVSYEGVIKDFTECKLAEERTKNLLVEKELLLKEVHHRIKNNLNTVSSLLTLHSKVIESKDASSALLDARNRVQCMGVLYDKLYRSEQLKEVSVKDYIPSLVREIISIFPNKDMIGIEIKIEDFMLCVKVLFPLGIIINEIITNSMKYAFSGVDNGIITISAALIDKCVRVEIGDNGKGCPSEIEMNYSGGFGLDLIKLLVKQLKGNAKFERHNGTKFIVEFNI